jgi:hypothetical protein
VKQIYFPSVPKKMSYIMKVTDIQGTSDREANYKVHFIVPPSNGDDIDEFAHSAPPGKLFGPHFVQVYIISFVSGDVGLPLTYEAMANMVYKYIQERFYPGTIKPVTDAAETGTETSSSSAGPDSTVVSQ